MKSEYIVIKREDLYMQSGFVDQYTGKSEAELDLINWLKAKNIEVTDEFELLKNKATLWTSGVEAWPDDLMESAVNAAQEIYYSALDKEEEAPQVTGVTVKHMDKDEPV